MAIEGIWTIEYYGAFGWETSGVLVLEHGRALGGGNNHYSVGTYKMKSKTITIDLKLDYFGTPRTLFGEKHSKFKVEFHGKQTGKSISGTVSRPDKKVIPLQFRMTKRAAL